MKNFTLVNEGEEYRLSPAYDLINTSLHLLKSGIFALNKGLFKEGMSFSDTRTIRRADFEEFGKRIGLSEKLIKRELDRFASKTPLIDKLIDRSFLSTDLKRQYRLSMSYRQQILSI